MAVDDDERQPGSVWLAHAPGQRFPSLERDIEVDVAIVGGGMFGATAAALLAHGGARVALLEARRVGQQATGRSTAKVTTQHGLIYTKLIEAHGRDGAQAYAHANQAALNLVRSLVRDRAIPCDLASKDPYVFTRDPDRTGELEEERESARLLGLAADVVSSSNGKAPLDIAAALRFPEQAQLHPAKYVAGLARAASEDGAQIFEHTRATEIRRGRPCIVATSGGTVRARDVVVATHLPFISEGKFFAKAYPYALPALAGPVAADLAPDGLFLSLDGFGISAIATTVGGEPYLVATGGAFKPGHDDEGRAQMAELEREAREVFALREIRHRWTNHDYRPMDGMPFVGKASHRSEHLYVGTGFNAWGLSNGTAAAMIVADAILGRANEWAGAFDATRLTPAASATSFIKENTGVARHLAGGYLAARPEAPERLAPGEAGVFEVDGRRVAAHRDKDGVLHEVSAVCTHLKCIVGWNPVEETWDCHCHGSRFGRDGRVISGPAVHPLGPPEA